MKAISNRLAAVQRLIELGDACLDHHEALAVILDVASDAMLCGKEDELAALMFAWDTAPSPGSETARCFVSVPLGESLQEHALN